MIFAVKGHVEKVVNDEKTQTRRNSDRYEVGRTYAIQRGRGKSGDSRGRILITHKWREEAYTPEAEGSVENVISVEDAIAEGGYTPDHYEMLYESMSPFWKTRWAYVFEFWSTGSMESLEKALKNARNNPSVKFDSLRPTVMEEES